MRHIQAELYKESFLGHTKMMEGKLGQAFNWGLPDKKAIKAIIENPLDQIAKASLNRKQREDIRRVLTQGFLQGKGYAQMARDMKKVYNTRAYEALRIARTEGQKAAVEGQRQSYERGKELGIKVKLYWDAFKDNRTRDSHIKMNGVPAEEKGGELLFFFEATGQWVTGPMDPALPAEHVINCRCRLREDISMEGLS